jgi:H+/Cl- antiporter ClcA
MAVEDFDHHLVPGLYALVGSAAMLAGVFRSSISLAVILLEGTGQIQYLLPILLTIGVAKITADIFVDGLNEVQLDLKEMPFLHREPARDMVRQIKPQSPLAAAGTFSITSH